MSVEATAPSTAAAGTSGAAPSSSPAPAAAPAAAPVTTSADAAAGAGGGDGAAPAAGAPTDLSGYDGKSTREIVAELGKKAVADNGAPPAAPAEPKVDPDAAAAVAAPQHGTEEEQAAAKKAEEDAAALAAKKDGEDELDDELPADDLTLEETGLVTPQSLFKEAESNPELAAAFEKNPAFKAELAKTLRLADAAIKIQAEVPTLQAAQFLKSQAGTFHQLETAIMSLTDEPKSFESVVAIMAGLDLMRDEDSGEIVKDAAGNAQRYGYTDKFLQHAAGTLLGAMAEEFEKSDDPEANAKLAAVKLIQESITRPSSASDAELPEHLKAKAEDLRKQQEALHTQATQAKAEKRSQLEKTLREDLTKTLDTKFIQHFCKLSDLNEFSTESVAIKARAEFQAKLEGDKVFIQQRDFLSKQPQTKEVIAERKRLVRGAMANYMPGIMRGLLKKAGNGVKEQQATRDAKRNAQVAANRHDPKGGGGAPLPAAQGDVVAKTTAFIDDFKKQHGREATTLDIVKYQRTLAR